MVLMLDILYLWMLETQYYIVVITTLYNFVTFFLVQIKTCGFFFKLINLFLIGGYLTYNIVFLSGMHQDESAIGIHMSPPS